MSIVLDGSRYDNHQKDKIAYVPLDPISDYVYIADLNTRLHDG